MSNKISATLFHFPAVYKFIFVIVVGVVIFFTGRKEIGNDRINEVILLIYCILKTIYFLISFFDRLKKTANNDPHYKDILSFIGFNALLIVLSYAIDYLCLYEINQQSFLGVTTRHQLVNHLVTFVYFSVSTFTTADLGDILPGTIVSKILMSFELMLSWFLTILVVANFNTIRENMKRSVTS